jgi:hypothetical protein
MEGRVREDALRLLRATRDVHVEQHGGNDESFRAQVTLDLAAAGERTGLPTGSERHELALEWLADAAAIEPEPMYEDAAGSPIYRVTRSGVDLLRDESMSR